MTNPATAIRASFLGWYRVIDWAFIRRGLEGVALTAVFALTTVAPIRSMDSLWGDAHLYFRATETWRHGGNPWLPTTYPLPFAEPPPALLLNLPRAPFGEDLGVAFWVAVNTLAILFLFSRLKIPPYWLLFQPIAEGWMGASPDLALAALALLGGGWLAALVKPYSVPALLSEGRWRAVVAGLAVGAVSLLVLPWGTFFASLPMIEGYFRIWGRPISAFGDPVLMILVAIALLALGGRRGLALVTPGLLAAHPHYMVFSLRAITRSRILAVFLSFSRLHSAALGVIAYALAESMKVAVRRLRGRSVAINAPA